MIKRNNEYFRASLLMDGKVASFDVRCGSVF